MNSSWLASLVTLLLCIAACAAQDAPRAPVAGPIEHISIWHGEKVNDPYFWLREKNNPEVSAISKPRMPIPRR